MSERDMRLYSMDILDSGSAILPPEVDSGLRRNDGIDGFMRFREDLVIL